MADQGPAAQTERKEGHVRGVDVGMCGLGRVQGCCLDMQRQDQECQDTNGTELGDEGYEK